AAAHARRVLRGARGDAPAGTLRARRRLCGGRAARAVSRDGPADGVRRPADRVASAAGWGGGSTVGGSVSTAFRARPSPDGQCAAADVVVRGDAASSGARSLG